MKKIINNLNNKISQKLIEIAPESVISFVHYYAPDPQKNIRDCKVSFGIWGRSVINSLIKLVVQFCSMIIGYSFLLHFVNYLWFIYKHTEAGAVFLSENSSSVVLATIHILQEPISPLVIDTCVNVLFISIAFGSIISLLAIKRYLYDARGILMQLTFASIISYSTVYTMESFNGYTQLKALMALHFLPTLCLMNISFELTSKLVPEFTDFFKYKNRIRKSVEIARIRNSD